MKRWILAIMSILFMHSVSAQDKMSADCLKILIDKAPAEGFPKGRLPVRYSGDSICYEKSLIILDYPEPETVLLFSNGLLYPELIVAARTNPNLKITMPTIPFMGNVKLSGLKRIHVPEQPVTTRAYSFLIWQEGVANPLMYILQIINDEARADTGTEQFFKGARLRCYGFCSVLI